MKSKLLFTDADSLCYEIETGDCYKLFYKYKDAFDFSDYHKDSPFYDPTNKKVIGKLKDEAAGIPIKEFIGLKSKMYSNVLDSGKNNKTAKGIKIHVIKKDIKQENYKKGLIESQMMRYEMKTIRSVNHQIGYGRPNVAIFNSYILYSTLYSMFNYLFNIQLLFSIQCFSSTQFVIRYSIIHSMFNFLLNIQ